MLALLLTGATRVSDAGTKYHAPRRRVSLLSCVVSDRDDKGGSGECPVVVNAAAFDGAEALLHSEDHLDLLNSRIRGYRPWRAPYAGRKYYASRSGVYPLRPFDEGRESTVATSVAVARATWCCARRKISTRSFSIPA